MVHRRTKILVTLGPASEDPEVFEAMMRAGIDAVRLNFSHGSFDEHSRRIKMVRACSDRLQRPIAILADLQGPKIRIGRFRNGSVTLEPGATFILDAKLDAHDGDEQRVGIDYKQLPEDVDIDDQLLLDDGRIVLTVLHSEASHITCRVDVGGELSNNKGINRLGGGLSAAALTEKDKTDLRAAVTLDADYLAVSFPRSADDIQHARQLLDAAGSNMGIIAKIERTEAVKNIDTIIEASEGVMVARGDLGVEIGDAELVAVQKHIIQRARSLNKPVITATQMMESMINNPIPTRAEVSDVANAVLDGTDTVMLSAESATGLYPVNAVAAMDRVCRGAERQQITRISNHRVECKFERSDEAIAMATMYTANHCQIKAIIALTESGSTPLWMSRIRSGIPIYAFTRHTRTERKVMLYRGVFPLSFDPTRYHDTTAVENAAIQHLLDAGFVRVGDWIVLTRGDVIGVGGHSNVMKILVV